MADEFKKPKSLDNQGGDKRGQRGDVVTNDNGSGAAKDSVLVPSSWEVQEGGLERYVVSKQIVRMREPGLLSPDDLCEKRIIFPESPYRKSVERFRELRTKLLEISRGHNFALVVSSIVPGGGASFNAINLAAAFAFDSSKTALLIDCNLRYPKLHSVFDLLPDRGVTDFLEDPDMDISTIIYPTGIRRLRLVPAGSQKESASEYFTSFRMHQFLQTLRRRYPDRFIILDTPPILESPDARILSEVCDYTLLIAPHGRVTESQVVEAASAIPEAKLAGVVVNG
ncbi:polysaccharide biosynthesis protein [Allohahella marinimesophila]|uniref:Polysaccharide biosynthesis protein n=1 Tax=Allohahella marinimesophila TaxID=1054972 RepID=A0ABP7QBD0_9GAMM